MSGKSLAELAEEQKSFWNGPGGQGWVASYQRIQRSLAPFSREALAAAAPQRGEHVVDVGCGSGDTTAELARAVGATGHVLGVDISEALIAQARSHRLDNATFVLGDAATHPFHAESHDLVFSRFGVMFFADPVAAFKNLRRALRPSGRLVFICWRTPQENPWGMVPLRAAAPFVPPPPRPGPEEPGQYSFGDRARVERILTQAGFAPTITPVDRPVFLGRTVPEVLENLGHFGPLSRAFANAEPAAIEKAKAAIGTALAPHAGPEGVMLPGACWLVSASQG
jgi:SAM-dependent methyltransferase